ncbi:MAG TPA: hypothetical protein VKU88_07700 [Acidimicrobiales bacterium]|nr:hypothetical protein [Acidimicrobiales bacterium]
MAGAAAVVVAAAVVMPARTAFADTSPGPSVPGLHCPPEQYPHGGAPRSAPPVPYEIPFTATLGQTDPAGLRIGGYLQIANSLVTATLGGPVRTDPTTGQPYGDVFASACGVLQLPSESGAIPGNPYGYGGDAQANNNFVFSNPTTVSLGITGIPGLPLLSAYADDDGSISTAIDKTPAANGGMNVEFYASAKSTSDFGPALSSLLGLLGAPSSGVTLPGPLSSLLKGVTNTAGSACTVAIGNLLADGVPPADVESGKTGLTYAQATAPVDFTSQRSGDLTGRPVTGPITGADATLVANDFPVGAIDPNTVPAAGDSGAVCSPTNASLLNSLLGLPSIPNPATGYYPNSFYAPGSFAVYTSS